MSCPTTRAGCTGSEPGVVRVRREAEIDGLAHVAVRAPTKPAYPSTMRKKRQIAGCAGCAHKRATVTADP